MRSRAPRRIAVTVVAVAATVALALPAMASGRDRTTLAGSVPAWATTSNRAGSANASDRISVHLLLGWRDAAGLRSLVASVTDPRSASYHHYLTAAQFRARFAPTSADVEAAAAWLRSQGFSVAGSPSSNLWVQATGTVAQAEAAFDVKVGLYHLGGKLVRAPESAPSVPSSLAGVVQGVLGLDGSYMRPLGISYDPNQPPPFAFVTGTPCSAYWGQKVPDQFPKAYGATQPFTVCGYDQKPLRRAYGVAGTIASGIDGTGVTVGIIDAFNAKPAQSDLTTYSSLHGLPKPIYDSFDFCPCPGNIFEKQGWNGEQTLDIEAVHSMAPGAAIQYVGAYSSEDTDINDAMAYMLDNTSAQIVSNSYGDLGEDLPQPILDESEALYEQAAAQGVGIYFSSGDSGDETLDLGVRETDYPASSPNVTAVGGTTLAVTSGMKYGFETYWGTFRSSLVNGHWSNLPGTWLYGGGGGTSQVFDEPSYQMGVVPERFSGYFGGEGRVVPDLSLDGDPNTGFVEGETQTFPDGSVKYSEYRIGGTSLSCPLMAGIMALADQQAGFAHGFLNPALYQLYSSDPGAFRDVTSPADMVAAVRSDFVNGVDGSDGRVYSLRTMNELLTLSSIPGFDDSTGMGSPNGQEFLDGLSGT